MLYLHLFKAYWCRTKIMKPNLHLLIMISMTLSSSHSHSSRKKKGGPIHKALIILFQDLGWPKAFPLCDLLIVVKLPNSTIKSIYFIAFLTVVLPVYHHSSPS